MNLQYHSHVRVVYFVHVVYTFTRVYNSCFNYNLASINDISLRRSFIVLLVKHRDILIIVYLEM